MNWMATLCGIHDHWKSYYSIFDQLQILITKNRLTCKIISQLCHWTPVLRPLMGHRAGHTGREGGWVLVQVQDSRHADIVCRVDPS